MEYVNLGSAGVKVSRICLGTMTYGTPKWRDWVLEEEPSRPFIKRALEAFERSERTHDLVLRRRGRPLADHVEQTARIGLTV